MSRKFKNNVGANTRPLIGGKEYTPPAEPPNLAAKFIRENPKGSIAEPDEPAMNLAGEPVSAATPPAPVAADTTPSPEPVVPDAAASPLSDAPALDAAAQAALDAVAPPKPAADAAGASGDVPTVVTAAQPEAQPQAAVPARDKYDPREAIPLLDGEPEWTRDDIVRGLQERATQQQEIQSLKPAVAERDQLLAALGARDVKAAMGFVEPFVKAIRENPARATLLDSVAAMDQATLNYVSQLLDDWKQLPVEQRAAFGQVGQVASPQAPADPRYDQLAANQQVLENSLVTDRAQREVTTILTEWPFLRQDRKAWEAIQSAATSLWNEDEAKGIPPLQRRGYLEAIAQNRVFLEHMKSAQERRVMQHASAAAAPSQLGTPPPQSAILPATHPQPPVAARPPRKEWRGPLDGAAAAFLADQGYTK